MDFISMFILPISKDHLSWKTTQYSGHFIHVSLFYKEKVVRTFFSSFKYAVVDKQYFLLSDLTNLILNEHFHSKNNVLNVF